MLPYEYYEKIEQKYIMAKGSTHYTKYMRRSQSCISEGIPISDQAALEQEEKQITA